MDDRNISPELISCEICLQEIPDSVSTNGEADEYVYYYCGIECYDKWQQQKK